MCVKTLVVLAVLLIPSQSHAEMRDRAILLGTQTEADVIAPAATALSAAGFEVVSGSGLSMTELGNFARLMLDDPGEGRRVILLEGAFVHDGNETWLLGRGARPQSRVDLASEGLPLSLVLEQLSHSPGGAALLLAPQEASPTGTGFQPGIMLPDIPQGVTVLEGAPDSIARLATKSLGARGSSLAAMAVAVPGIRASGFLAPLVPFRPKTAPEAAPPAALGTSPEDASATSGQKAPENEPTGADAAAWEMAETLDEASAYQAYLTQYPQGEQAEAARQRLDRLRAEALLGAAEAESRIGLSREQRRDLQRALGRLGYPTRGLDGVFGQNTRAAVQDWQAAQGLEATGFLTQAQTLLILETAILMQEPASPAPDMPLAKTDTGAKPVAPPPEQGAVPSAADATQTNTAPATSSTPTAQTVTEEDPAEVPALAPIPPELAYLRRYPDGLFAEAALALGPERRKAINDRLIALQLMPGPSSDDLTAESRAALKLFQETNGLTVTGYVNQPTWWALLAGNLPETGPDIALKNAADD